MKKSILFLAILLNIIAFTQKSFSQYREPYQKYVTYEVDISTLSANDSIIFQTFYTSEMGFEVKAVGITGAANGVINFSVTNDTIVPGSTYIVNSKLPYTVPSANFTQAFEKTTLPLRYLIMHITKNGMTGGTLYVNFENKRKAER